MRRIALGGAALLIAAAWVLAGDRKEFPPLGPLPPPPSSPDNPSTPAKVALGRALFFDPRLSRDGTLACATCHNPALAFQDGLPRTRGKKNKELGRNTPTVLNAAYQTAFFWDARTASLERQSLEPMSSEDEMDHPAALVVERIGRIPGYRRMFKEAFGPGGLVVGNAAKAIAAYERTLVSTDTAFDRHARGDAAALSEAARRGLALFEGKANCLACHNGPLMSDGLVHNIGVPRAGPWKTDEGRMMVDKDPRHRNAFKTPPLRNAALTAPYMHDGAFATLEQVMDFYDRGGDVKEGLDPEMKPLGLSSREKSDLVAFLKDLTDVREALVPVLPPDHE